MDNFAFHQARQFGSTEGYGPLAQLLEALRKRWENGHRQSR
jgi:hypothetical protein